MVAPPGAIARTKPQLSLEVADRAIRGMTLFPSRSDRGQTLPRGPRRRAEGAAPSKMGMMLASCSPEAHVDARAHLFLEIAAEQVDGAGGQALVEPAVDAAAGGVAEKLSAGTRGIG